MANQRTKCPYCETIKTIKTFGWQWCVKCGRMWLEEPVNNERLKCPDCGSINVYYRKTYKNWRCRKCGCEKFIERIAQADYRPNSVFPIGVNHVPDKQKTWWHSKKPASFWWAVWITIIFVILTALIMWTGDIIEGISALVYYGLLIFGVVFTLTVWGAIIVSFWSKHISGSDSEGRYSQGDVGDGGGGGE